MAELHPQGTAHVPWFGYQLACGNSLVGARRQVYDSGKLGKDIRRKGERWFNFAPERVATARPGAVYHFLLPDPGMADYRNKAAKRYEPDNFDRIKEWRRLFCQPFNADEIAELEALSAQVDEPVGATQRATRQRPPGDRRLAAGMGDGRPRPAPRRTDKRVERPHPRTGRVQPRHPHGRPLPPPEAGDGLLVRPVVLADRRGQEPCRRGTSS